MTTIIATRTGIFADTKLAGGGSGPYAMEKVIRMSDGSLIAGVGTINQLGMLIQAVETSMEGKEVKTQLETNELTAVRLTPEGELLYYDHCSVPFKCLDDEVYMGSGADIARTAVRLELSYEDAMEISAELDDGTSDDYSFYPLSEEEVNE